MYFSFTFVLMSIHCYQKPAVSPIFDSLDSRAGIDTSNYREPLCARVFLPKITHEILKWGLGPVTDAPKPAVGLVCTLPNVWSPGATLCILHNTEVVSVLRSFQVAQVVLGYACALPNLDREYNFQKKRTLTLKSLLKCLNVGLRPFVLIFSLNIVSPLDPSSFVKLVLCVAKMLHNKFHDLISVSHSLVCGILKGTVLSQGLYPVGLCSDCLDLEAVGQLKTSPGLDCQDNACSRMLRLCALHPGCPGRHLRLHPCTACPTNLNVLVN